MIERDDFVGALEAVLLASGSPLSVRDLRKVFERAWKDKPSQERESSLSLLDTGIEDLKNKWAHIDPTRGIELYQVAGGLALRSNRRYAKYIRAMGQEKTARLSKAAMEALAIVAYRQPVTKPEVDSIRGVDGGGTLRLLLERGLIRMVGKKEEPGRPILYGTTKSFLDFFNLPNLSHLPSLREYQELTNESREELSAFDGLGEGLSGLKKRSADMHLKNEPQLDDLGEAIDGLRDSEKNVRTALEGVGIQLQPQSEGTEGTEYESPLQSADDVSASPLVNQTATISSGEPEPVVDP
jgi:segregation and condensation protein B